MNSNQITHRSPRAWLKISIDAPAASAEILSAYLTELTGSGIEIISSQETQTERLIAYLAEDEEAAPKLANLYFFLDNLPDRQSLRVQNERIIEEDWGHAWKSHFKPLLVTPRLAIKPSWESYQPRQGEAIIEMDPGMAFGTGLHASTRLCLDLIDACYSPEGSGPQRILDVGTGTGVLAMACALLGARQAVAVDNDPDAVFAADENVRRNHLEEIIEVTGRGIENLPGSFDLVIANIIFDTLLQLAPVLTRLVAGGGSLILAGILRGEQEKGIAARYAASFTTQTVRHQEEWAAFRLIRRM